MITKQDTVLVGYSSGLAGAIALLVQEIVRQNPSFESAFRSGLLECSDQLKTSKSNTILEGAGDRSRTGTSGFGVSRATVDTTSTPSILSILVGGRNVPQAFLKTGGSEPRRVCALPLTWLGPAGAMLEY